MGVNPVTVKELIEFLKTQPQDMLVAYQRYSEQCCLELKHISTMTGSVPRIDGWIENQRPDKYKQKYLVLPGN